MAPSGPTALTPPDPMLAPVEWKKYRLKFWATVEQWIFLKGGVSDYCTAQAVKGKKVAIAKFIKEFLPKF